MPQVLKELMRHEDIQTTMRYYVGRNAQTTADALWFACEEKRVEKVPFWVPPRKTGVKRLRKKRRKPLIYKGLLQCPLMDSNH